MSETSWNADKSRALKERFCDDAKIQLDTLASALHSVNVGKIKSSNGEFERSIIVNLDPSAPDGVENILPFRFEGFRVCARRSGKISALNS